MQPIVGFKDEQFAVVESSLSKIVVDDGVLVTINRKAYWNVNVSLKDA